MPIKLSQFINEALNDPHEFFETFDVPAYILGQYEFEHNGIIFAVRFTKDATKYGKRVSDVRFGRKVNKNISKKLPNISGVRKFLATVVAIIKHHVLFSDNSKAQAKMDGFVIHVPEDSLDIISNIVKLTLKRTFKTYIVYPDYTTNLIDEDRKAVLIHRFVKSPDQVFSKIDLDEPVALSPSDIDLELDDEIFDDTSSSVDDTYNADTSSTSSDDAAAVYGDQIPGDETEEDLSSIKSGIYLTKMGKHILIKDKGDGTSRLWNVDIASKQVVSSSTDFLNDMISEMATPFEWKTTIWFTSHDPDKTPYIVYSLKHEPNTVFSFIPGNVQAYSIEDVLNGNTPFGRAIPQSKAAVFPHQDTNLYTGLTEQPAQASAVFELENSSTHYHDRYANELTNKNGVIVELNVTQIKGFLDMFPEERFDFLVLKRANKILSIGKDAPQYAQSDLIANPFPDDVDFSNIPKLTDKWTDVVDWINKLNIRTEDNQPSSVSLFSGLLHIDYEDDIMEIRDKFSRLKAVTGGDQDRIKELMSQYLEERNSNARKFTKKVSLLQSEDPDLAYDETDLENLNIYTGSGYKNINNKLRDNKPLKPESFGGKFVKEFDELFQYKGMQLPKGLIMYRGQSNSDDEIYSFINGDPVEFAAYVSCTISPNIAANFTKTGGNLVDFAMTDSKDTDFGAFDVDNYKARKRNKIMMSIKDAHKIPVLVPGKYSSVPNESEVILPRGVKLVADSDIIAVQERIYVGTFKISGIRGLNQLLESDTFKKFKMFCEQQTASQNHVKEMAVDVLIADYLNDIDRDPEEFEDMQNFFERMASQG